MLIIRLDVVQKKLRLAANTGDTDLIRKLLDDGVDPCVGDCRNRTALHFAACKGDVTAGKYYTVVILITKTLVRTQLVYYWKEVRIRICRIQWETHLCI